MKNKLTHYLNQELEILNDVLMQTREIKKSIINDDMEYANRLISGRGVNLKKADQLQNAILDILNRSTDETGTIDKKVDSLKEKTAHLLKEIKKIDDEINEMISKEYAEAKKEHKMAKQVNILKKGYSSKKNKLPPKLFDKKT